MKKHFARSTPPPHVAVALTARQALRLGDNIAAIALLEEWLEDESGYDEAVWPQMKSKIKENRSSAQRYIDGHDI